jgi:hypothetical protein
MLRAKQLIEMGRYEEAKRILILIDHPTAEKWLEKLNRVTPSRIIEKQKSYTNKSILVLVLYWILYIPGLIANLVYLLEARKITRDTGRNPEGAGCLQALFIIFGVLPIAFVLVIFFVYVFVARGGSDSGPFIYSLF